MPDEVIIREATVEDAEAISALVGSLAPFYLADPGDRAAAVPFFESVSAAATRGHITSGQVRFHVAEVGGELAGAVGVIHDRHLYHLFVAERFHRRGIAARLWAVAKAAARAAGGSGRFTVNASLSARPVYERFGFEAVGPEVRKHGVAFVPMVLDERQEPAHRADAPPHPTGW